MKTAVTTKSSPTAPVSLKNKALDMRDKQKVAAFWGESAPGSDVSFFTFGPIVDYLVQCVGYRVPATWPAYKRFIFAIAKRVNAALVKWQANKPKGFRFGQVWDSAPERVRRIDPSEGVRSDEIIPVVLSIFADTTVRYFNGSILHLGLDRKFFANYDPDRDRLFLDLLLEIERRMIDLQEIPPIPAVMVARK